MKSCHNCKDRVLGCHSVCINYILYDALNEHRRNADLKKQRTRMDVNAHVTTAIKRQDRRLPK